jgi:KDO2-lipid IV(A) lauroyltransferase
MEGALDPEETAGQVLDKGGIVTISIDQNGGKSGLFVPSFGVLASTLTSPAELHLASGSPIAVVTLVRLPDGKRHELRVWDVIEQAPTADHASDVAAVTSRINAAYEKAIRAHPEQWLWVHQRWKTRPPGETPKE